MIDAAIMAIAKQELQRAHVPLPPELIEAVISIESGGQIGNTNETSGASGLMQIMPGTLIAYSRATKDRSISLGDLRRTDKGAAVLQIRVGIWVLATYWKKAYEVLKPILGVVPVDELARFADLFYVAGPGRVIPKIRKLSHPPTYEKIVAAYPNWNALPHPRRVFGYRPETEWTTKSWDLVAIDKWLRGSPLISSLKNPLAGFVMAGVLLAVATSLFKSSKTGNQK